MVGSEAKDQQRRRQNKLRRNEVCRMWRYVAYYMRQWSLLCHNLPKDEEDEADKEDDRHEKT